MHCTTGSTPTGPRGPTLWDGVVTRVPTARKMPPTARTAAAVAVAVAAGAAATAVLWWRARRRREAAAAGRAGPHPQPTQSYWEETLRENIETEAKGDGDALGGAGAAAPAQSSTAKTAAAACASDAAEAEVSSDSTEPWDTVIIGSGLAGSSLAYWLTSERGGGRRLQRVLVLDARAPAEGSGAASTRNGGHMWPFVESWNDIVKAHGEESAVSAAQLQWRNARSVVSFVNEHKVDCELEETKGYILFVSRPDESDSNGDNDDSDDSGESLTELEEASQAAEQLHRWGIVDDDDATVLEGHGAARVVVHSAEAVGRSITSIVRTETPPVKPASWPSGGPSWTDVPEELRFSGAMRLKQAWRLHPAKLVAGLVRVSQQQGAQFASHCVVNDVRRNGAENTFELCCEDGRRFSAKRIVYAANAYTRRLLRDSVISDVIVPVRNQVIVTTPLPPASSAGHPAFPYSLSSDEGHFYLMQRSDGRVVAGGLRNLLPGRDRADDDDSVDSFHPIVSAALRSRVAALLRVRPCDVVVESTWSGVMGFTEDEFPVVGEVPGRPGEFVAAGFNGSGNTFVFECARALAHELRGAGAAPWLPDRFRPDRFTLW